LPKYKKPVGVFVLITGIIVIIALGNHYLSGPFNYRQFIQQFNIENRCRIPVLISSRDVNNNGVYDALDIVNGARQEVISGVEYDSSYYSGGYPPDEKGACTDVVWRALAAAGYNLKEMVDEDIKEYPVLYNAAGMNPDPNIDFRRVKNLQVFFKRHADQLTTEAIPGDIDNLKNWQAGDIVIFGDPLEHIGIISDKRRWDGIPLVIHNSGPKAAENDILLNWPTKITYHFHFEP
jgi:hypothetical protein